MIADFSATFVLILRTADNPKCIPELNDGNIMSILKRNNMETRIFANGPSYIWTLSKRFENCTDIDTTLSKFLACVPDYYRFVQRLKQYGACVIRLSVVSAFGQFGFGFSPNDIGILNQLSIPLEITVFSFGDCIGSGDSDIGKCSEVNDSPT